MQCMPPGNAMIEMLTNDCGPAECPDLEVVKFPSNYHLFTTKEKRA